MNSTPTTDTTAPVEHDPGCEDGWIETADGYTSCRCNIPADYRIYDGLTKTELECQMDAIGDLHTKAREMSRETGTDHSIRIVRVATKETVAQFLNGRRIWPPEGRA